MEANAGMVAGSYKRNELVRIRHDSDSGVSAFPGVTLSGVLLDMLFFSVVVVFIFFVYVSALLYTDLTDSCV